MTLSGGKSNKVQATVVPPVFRFVQEMESEYTTLTKEFRWRDSSWSYTLVSTHRPAVEMLI